MLAYCIQLAEVATAPLVSIDDAFPHRHRPEQYLFEDAQNISGDGKKS